MRPPPRASGTSSRAPPVSVISYATNPYLPTAEKPSFTLTAVPGATLGAPLNNWVRYAYLTADADKVVFGQYRESARMCTAVHLTSGTGGVVAATNSTFSVAAAPYEDKTGRCTTAAGKPGYLAGSQVTLTSMPINSRTLGKAVKPEREYYTYQWLTDPTVDPNYRPYRYNSNGVVDGNLPPLTDAVYTPAARHQAAGRVRPVPRLPHPGDGPGRHRRSAGLLRRAVRRRELRPGAGEDGVRIRRPGRHRPRA